MSTNSSRRGAARAPRAPRDAARRRTTAGIFAATCLLLLATQLWAHTALRRAMPGAGDRVPAPHLLWLEFSESVELSGTAVSLADSAGTAMRVGAPAHPSDSGGVIVVPVAGTLAPGRYQVTWQATARDGHPARGSYAFEVVPSGPSGGSAVGPNGLGSPPPPGGPPQLQSAADSLATRNQTSAAATSGAPAATSADAAQAPAIDAFDTESGAYVALRWLSYVMLVAGIGAVVMARVTDRAATVGARHAVQTRLAAVGLTATWLGVALALARLLAQSWAIHGPDRAMSPTLIGPLIGTSSWGRAWALQLAAALVGATGFTLALNDASRRGGWRVAQVAALLAAAGTALGGHAAAAEGWRAPVLVLADLLHILGAGAWIGGVMMLAIAVLTRAAAPAAANVVRAFSPWAMSGAALLTVTGFVAAWVHLERPLAPWTSHYGRVLLVKLACVAAIILLGALNWQRFGPASSTAPGNTTLRRSVWLEVLVALLVLAATAVLVAIDPARP